MSKRLAAAALAATLLTGTALAQAGALHPDREEFRGLYKELVETNTTLSAGSCTLASERMAARLQAAGIPAANIHLFSVPEHPKEGGLVVVYPGSSKTLKPMLMLAHIDVVEANRADWERDPFTLIEENGYFYARGAYDDKAQAAIYTDALIRFAKTGYKPKRTVKLALTCGEETSGAFNGAEWLGVAMDFDVWRSPGMRLLVAMPSRELMGELERRRLQVIGLIVAVVLLLLPADAGPITQAIAFLLFRLFDIAKPPPIGLLDARIDNGLGVMLDDLVAAFYTLLVLAIALRVAGKHEIGCRRQHI